MAIRTIFLILLFALRSIAQEQYGSAHFSMDVSSYLKIKGSSNVNKFECEILGENLEKQVDVDYNNNGNRLTFRKFHIKLPVQHFDCGNSMLTSDFKETLKADEYPTMTIQFLQIYFPDSLEYFEKLFPTGILANVHLTDKTKKYYIGLERESLEGDLVTLRGNLAVNMLDFDLSPPTKMFSLIKVDPLLDIQFKLKMIRKESD